MFTLPRQSRYTADLQDPSLHLMGHRPLHFKVCCNIIKIKHLNVSNPELYSGAEYTVCVIGECEFVSLANPFTPVGKTTFLVKQ